VNSSFSLWKQISSALDIFSLWLYSIQSNFGLFFILSDGELSSPSSHLQVVDGALRANLFVTPQYWWAKYHRWCNHHNCIIHFIIFMFVTCGARWRWMIVDFLTRAVHHSLLYTEFSLPRRVGVCCHLGLLSFFCLPLQAFVCYWVEGNSWCWEMGFTQLNQPPHSQSHFQDLNRLDVWVEVGYMVPIPAPQYLNVNSFFPGCLSASEYPSSSSVSQRWLGVGGPRRFYCGDEPSNIWHLNL